MAHSKSQSIKQIQDKLKRYPDVLHEEFDRSLRLIATSVTNSQIVMWAQIGLEITEQGSRSWETASKYFKVSPVMLGSIPFNHFIKWAEYGSSLCSKSHALATSYFQSSPKSIESLSFVDLEKWSNLGDMLSTGTWKSNNLACDFFKFSPELLKNSTFTELEELVKFLHLCSGNSMELAIDCLNMSRKFWSSLKNNKMEFLSLASTLFDTTWRETKGLFESIHKSLPKIPVDQRFTFITLSEHLVKSNMTNIPAAILGISEALGQIPSTNHSRILEMCDTLVDTSGNAALAFISNCPTVLKRITPEQIDDWYAEGLNILKQNPAGGMAYFKIESSRSEKILENLSSSVDFDRIENVMEMYCRGLAGEEVELATTVELVDKNIGWVSNESPSTEGVTVFLPAIINRYSTKEENFSWFKVISTHQVAHIEFGSFRFEFATPSNIFTDTRSILETKQFNIIKSEDDSIELNTTTITESSITDMQRFFNLFNDRTLALDIFSIVEDGRLDTRVLSEYLGIKRAYISVQYDSIIDRPEIKSLPAKEALVEFLVRVTLQKNGKTIVPMQYKAEANKILGLVKRILIPYSTVEDVSEATIRIYAVISQIPNSEVEQDQWDTINIDESNDMYSEEDDLDQLIDQMNVGNETQSDKEYQPAKEVDYRGDFKPELVQLLSRLRKSEQSGDEDGITQEQLEELIENSAELSSNGLHEESHTSHGAYADNILKETGSVIPNDSEYIPGDSAHVEEEGDSLEPTEPQTFVYDEWDFRANDYKPRWCIVKQKTMDEGDPSYFTTTLHGCGPLVTQIRRQFEMMVPEMFRKVRRLEDGDEIDIDDVIEAMVDIRTGASPSDKYYWRRNKVQRDVAVAFLLDTSASTAEAIEETHKLSEYTNVPKDPSQYMSWLQTKRSASVRQTHKRIIDIEKEALVLVINALEAIGDIYGIYGFSGYGRENVEFYVIKDLEETFSDMVKKRIDRISPLHATRMGPAIRHTTSKLDKQDARTKLLFLISDGRPQDRGYSREGVEKEYAVHDTKMALTEAKSKGINAFCLTVDKNGHDYLKTMCQDIGYEALDDIFSLPERLLFLYKRLTM